MSFKRNILLPSLLFIAVFLAGASIGLSAESMASRLSGRILLQTESDGQAWYVNPVDKRRYFLGSPSEAFAVMKKLGLGISNKDITKIPTAGTQQASRPPAKVAAPVAQTPPVPVSTEKHYCPPRSPDQLRICSRGTSYVCGYRYAKHCTNSKCYGTYTNSICACNDPQIEYYISGFCPQ